MRMPTAQGYRRWLEELHPRTKVGVCEIPSRCPIAHFTRFINLEADEVEVDGSTVTFFTDRIRTEEEFGDLGLDYHYSDSGRTYRNIDRRPLPEWAKRFVGIVDQRAAGKSAASVSAQAALTDLDKAASRRRIPRW